VSSFDVAAESYDRFMGRFSTHLSAQLADYAGVASGQRVLDVGSGPGALTAELVQRLAAEKVAAVDPSEPFVEAARTRHPGVDVRLASAEELPYAEDEFDASIAQLVVHFMADPVAGLSEMARVTKPGGVVAACVWDLDGGRAPLSLFWQAARDLDERAEGEGGLPGAREGQLEEYFRAAGLREVEGGELAVEVEHPTFEEWWEPYTFGVGPVGAYTQSLDERALEELRERCRELLPEPPFTLTGVAWVARGSAGP